MHLHLGDLFEVSTDPIYSAVANGVTMGLSPGAGSGLYVISRRIDKAI